MPYNLKLQVFANVALRWRASSGTAMVVFLPRIRRLSIRSKHAGRILRIDVAVDQVRTRGTPTGYVVNSMVGRSAHLLCGNYDVSVACELLERCSTSMQAAAALTM